MDIDGREVLGAVEVLGRLASDRGGDDGAMVEDGASPLNESRGRIEGEVRKL